MSPEVRSNQDLVVFALSTMGSSADRFHTEAIAIRCHELFPTSFSWTTRPDLPDKDVVRHALMDARNDKLGRVEGRAGQGRGQYRRTQRGPMLDGWRLTEAGLAWIEINKARFETLFDASQGSRGTSQGPPAEVTQEAQAATGPCPVRGVPARRRRFQTWHRADG